MLAGSLVIVSSMLPFPAAHSRSSIASFSRLAVEHVLRCECCVIPCMDTVLEMWQNWRT